MPSLTGELRNRGTPLREYMEATLPDMRSLLRAWPRPELEIAPPRVPPHLLGRIGAAFDYRVRLAHERIEASGIAAYRGWKAVSVRAEWQQRREQRGLTRSAQARRRDRIVARRLDPVSQVVDRIDQLTGGNPLGAGALPTPHESKLLGLCWLLAMYEECYRAGARPDHPAVELGPFPPWHQLAALLPDSDVLADLARLLTSTIRVAPELLGGGATCNPRFDSVPGLNADADLIVDGCLWELKTTARPGFNRVAIYQLVGYALLDATDQYQITMVGIYRPRFACVQKWLLDDLLAQLAGRAVELSRMRAEFIAEVHSPCSIDTLAVVPGTGCDGTMA